MRPYDEAVRRFKVAWLARAVIDSGGSMCAAARNTGVHRNIFQRYLRPAGYDPARLRRLAKIHGPKAQPGASSERKPVAIVPVVDLDDLDERRRA